MGANRLPVPPHFLHVGAGGILVPKLGHQLFQVPELFDLGHFAVVKIFSSGVGAHLRKSAAVNLSDDQKTKNGGLLVWEVVYLNPNYALSGRKDS